MGETKTIKPSHVTRFRKLARDMAKLLSEIRRYCPEANLYLEDAGNWNLLTGDSHDENDKMRQDRLVTCVYVPHSGGGGW
jgi:hypothetical protein